MNTFDVNSLRQWFLSDQRDLPWRQNPTPYMVWVSEVMLQQTQVAVVIPYFTRWLERFPTIEHLANATLDEVIKEWEGLGYYSRVRNLHAGAKQVLEQFNGVLPSEESLLSTIKGLGPYTVGAIRAFAFKQKAAAIDGNVLRVLSRHEVIEEDITKSKTVAQVRQRVLEILPENDPWIITEALIELGATICSRQPKCEICPLRQSCKGFAQGIATKLPVKKTPKKTTFLYRSVAVLVADGQYLVQRGDQGKVMSDLHEFPYIETNADNISSAQLQAQIEKRWNLIVDSPEKMQPIKHGFTRYTVQLSPVIFQCRHKIPVEGYQWKTLQELRKLAFSSGHRRIFQTITEESQ